MASKANIHLWQGGIREIIKMIEQVIKMAEQSDEFHIIEMSWGGYEWTTDYIRSIQNAVNRANKVGIILVAGAGNDQSSHHFYPAAFKNVISVGSYDYTNENSDSCSIKHYSNYGQDVSLFACGICLNSDGTSFAAPRFAAILAITLGAIYEKHHFIGSTWTKAKRIISNLFTKENGPFWELLTTTDINVGDKHLGTTRRRLETSVENIETIVQICISNIQWLESYGLTNGAKFKDMNIRGNCFFIMFSS